MSSARALNSTWPLGVSMKRLQYSCSPLFGGVGAVEMLWAVGSYSKNWIGEPQSLFMNLADATSTLPFGINVPGQSLHTMVWPPTWGMSGPAVQVPVPAGVADGE